ncbi:MAG: hypothetical protein ACE5G8_06780, partial [Anaerolineae bacterium]
MKSLKEALIDYDISQLQSLALKRGLAFPGARSREALDAFVDELLAPASIAIAVNDLSADELAALKHLLNNGGFVEARAFSRRFGAVRAMGSNRLLREKPWESPANPAEGLWYRGLIFKGFHHTLQGPEEIIFIPGDLQPVLPVAPPQTPPFRVGLAADPAHVYPAAPLAREDVFTLLAYLQSNFVRLAAGDSFPADHRRAVCSQFSLFQTAFRAGRGDDPSAAGQLQAERDSWFEFILHTTRRLDFLRRQGQRLKLNINAVKAWLQSAPADQLRQVQHTWRADPTWNDLRHLPGLHPKDTGWENSPLLAWS